MASLKHPLSPIVRLIERMDLLGLCPRKKKTEQSMLRNPRFALGLAVLDRFGAIAVFWDGVSKLSNKKTQPNPTNERETTLLLISGSGTSKLQSLGRKSSPRGTSFGGGFSLGSAFGRES